MTINIKAIYNSYHWLFSIHMRDTPQAELAQKTMKFNCVCHKLNL